MTLHPWIYSLPWHGIIVCEDAYEIVLCLERVRLWDNMMHSLLGLEMSDCGALLIL